MQTENFFYLTNNKTVKIMQFLIMGLTIVSVILVSDIALNDKFVYGQFLDTESDENETNDILSIPAN